MYLPHFNNKHLQTILPSLFRKIKGVKYTRERIETPDHDFIDIDWSKVGSHSVVFLLHGLEGHSSTQYIKGLVKVLNNHGHDTVSINFRSCSGETNKLLSSYNCGVSDDLKFVIQTIHSRNLYHIMYGVGFSLGGNVLLKYLGEEREHSLLKKAVGVSVPVDLASSALHLEKGFNKVYLNRFLRRLKEKVKQKEQIFPNGMAYKKIYTSKTFREFDNYCTAPVHGYKNAEDYWKKCSSKPLIGAITTPTIIINALNDPFLPQECYPYAACNDHKNVVLDTPKYGGHVGFPSKENKLNYYEDQIIRFFK